MKLAARETLKYDLPANRQRGTELNTAVFTCHILNTNVLFGKPGQGILNPSEEGSLF
jgi:hypothetical protein